MLTLLSLLEARDSDMEYMYEHYVESLEDSSDVEYMYEYHVELSEYSSDEEDYANETTKTQVVLGDA